MTNGAGGVCPPSVLFTVQYFTFALHLFSTQRVLGIECNLRAASLKPDIVVCAPHDRRGFGHRASERRRLHGCVRHRARRAVRRKLQVKVQQQRTLVVCT